MTHEKHFLLNQQFPLPTSASKGSIVKRCVYFGLSSPFFHYLPPPPPTHTHTHHTRMKSKPYCKLPLSPKEKKSPHLAPPISFGEEAKCYFAEFRWQFLVRAPCTFLAKCCKINSGPLSFSDLRWSGREGKQAHASEKMGNW